MVFTRKHWILVGTVTTVLVVALIVGVTVGVVVGRKQPEQQTLEQRTQYILAEHPVIDG